MSKLSQYHGEVAQSDISYALNTFTKSDKILKTSQMELNNDLLSIVKYVKQAKTLDGYWNHLTFLLNPIGWLSSDDFIDLDEIEGLANFVSTLVRENNMKQMENVLTKVTHTFFCASIIYTDFLVNILIGELGENFSC